MPGTLPLLAGLLSLWVASPIAAEGPATAPAAGPPRVAVLELGVRGQVPAETSEYLSELFRTGARHTLGRSHLVMTRESMFSLVPQRRLMRVSQARGEVEAGRTLGATYVLSGQLSRVEGLYRLMVKLFDTRSGDLLHSATFKADSGSQLVERVERTAGKVFESLWPTCPPGMRYDRRRERCLDASTARCPAGTHYVRNQGCLQGRGRRPPPGPTAFDALAQGPAGLLQHPSPQIILQAMRAVEPQVRRCAGAWRGAVSVQVRVSGAGGRVVAAHVSGPARPTADCMARAVRKASFPVFSSFNHKFNYTFRL